MTSEKQLRANRRNAERSTGPRTHKGKNRSKLNATRHNLTGQVAAMTEPDRVFFDLFVDGIVKDLAPEGALEIQLAQRIAHDHWRLNRSAAIEDNLYALGHYQHEAADPDNHAQIEDAFSAAQTFAKQAKNLQLLSLYEQRMNRTLQKNLAELKTLQAERKAARREALAEAALLTQTEAPAQTIETAAPVTVNGFVFSTDEVAQYTSRLTRLQAATKSLASQPILRRAA
jgi:hypothetical protein